MLERILSDGKFMPCGIGRHLIEVILPVACSAAVDAVEQGNRLMHQRHLINLHVKAAVDQQRLVRVHLKDDVVFTGHGLRLGQHALQLQLILPLPGEHLLQGAVKTPELGLAGIELVVLHEHRQGLIVQRLLIAHENRPVSLSLALPATSAAVLLRTSPTLKYPIASKAFARFSSSCSDAPGLTASLVTSVF
ncbi:hypothetical protein D3C77_287040 [compost metagenome]